MGKKSIRGIGVFCMKKKSIIIALIALIGFAMTACIVSCGGGINLNGDKQKIRNTAREFAEEIDETVENYIEVLQSLSNEMSFYESLTPGTRRREFENLMLSVFDEIPEFDQMFTVWKPDAIDGMDERFKGRAGSTETGQFAFVLTRGDGLIDKQTGDVQAAMAHLTGPDSKTVEISPAKSNLARWDNWCIRIMVPIINDRNNESVGVIGCYINTDTLQELAEKEIKYNDEVYSIAVYTNTGFILASYVPDHIGRQMVDVEIQYGDHVKDADNAVENALEYECASYDPALKVNMFMCIAPVPLPASPVTWSVMIGSTENYISRTGRAVTKHAITLLIIAGMIAIIIFVIYIDRKKKKEGRGSV